MDCFNASRRMHALAGRLAVCAVGLALVCTAPARADQLERHSELVTRFVNDLHADPLVADCAAHGDFIVSTSGVLDHVEFPASSFDSAHASVTPWNDSFDEGKQRVKVDTVVQVDGIGIPQRGDSPPLDLKFRCGYVSNQMLAFSWNDPQPPTKAHGGGSGASSGAHGRGKHPSNGKGSQKKSSGTGTKKSVSSQSNSTSQKVASKGSANRSSTQASIGKISARQTSATTKKVSTGKKPSSQSAH